MLEDLKLMGLAADAMSEADLMDKMIHGFGLSSFLLVFSSRACADDSLDLWT